MTIFLPANNAETTLAGAITAGATSLTIQTADQSEFPNPGAGQFFPVTLFDGAGNMEIVHCTARAGAVLTVARGQEGTTAQAWASGVSAELRFTKGAIDAKKDVDAVEPIATGGTGATTAVAGGDALSVRGAAIPSAATVDLATSTGQYVEITGTATITSFGTMAAGVIRRLRFAGAAPITHSANIILPAGINITTKANDILTLVSEGGGVWRLIGRESEGQTTTVLAGAGTAPPGSPTNGAPYLVQATATGLWAGQENKLAVTNDGGTTWSFTDPLPGSTLVDSNGVIRVVNGAGQVVSPKLTNLNGGPVGGLENPVINGGFDVAQEGISFTINTGVRYTLDQWEGFVAAGAGDSMTVLQQGHTLGQTDVPGNPKHYVRCTLTGGNNVKQFFQRMEGVHTFAGEEVTVIFAVRANAAVTISPLIAQTFGTGGSPSGGVNTFLTPVNVTTAWQIVRQKVTIPSIAGKTLGTNNDDYLAVYLLNDNLATTIEFSEVSILKGDHTQETVMPARRSIGQELALCQRFFGRYALSAAQVTGGTGSILGNMLFPVTMRATPTVTQVANNHHFGQLNVTTTTTTYVPTTSGITFWRTCTGTVSPTQFSELTDFDARL